MNTPAHLILGAAVFARPGAPGRTWAALAGGLAPDLSLYLMVAAAINVWGIPARQVFGQLYYSDIWQQVFAIDNSFILWGIGFAFALWAGAKAGAAFTGAGLLHLAFDFPLHNDDARMHFWPLTDWRYISPYSYWDTNLGASWIGWVEIALVLALTAWLWMRFAGWGMRAVFALIAVGQVAPFFVWRLVF